jgi:hypothetical protein
VNVLWGHRYDGTRIRETAETQAAGVSGRVGPILGVVRYHELADDLAEEVRRNAITSTPLGEAPLPGFKEDVLLLIGLSDDSFTEIAADLFRHIADRTRCVLVSALMTDEMEPRDVFTPHTVATRTMFTRRNEPDLHGNSGLQDLLMEAIRERGSQIVLYGDTGVGKTSLFQYAAEDVGASPVIVRCSKRRSFEEHIEEALRQLVDFQEVEVTERTDRAKGGEAGITKLVTVKGSITREDGTQSRFEAIRRPPLEALLQAMQENECDLLVFDNAQNLDEVERFKVAAAVERLSDMEAETGNIKLVIIGIADDALSLIGQHDYAESVRRRMTTIGVPRMPDDEIAAIFENGFALLRLHFAPDGEVLGRLVFMADGFPYFAHLLGLNVARVLRRRKDPWEVDDAAVAASLQRAAQEVEEPFEARLHLAFEVTGNVQPRRRILEVMAHSENRELTSAQVIEEYSHRFGKPSDPAFLDVALAQLIHPDQGAVLRRVGPRGRFRYMFREPQMRPYLRITHFAPQLPLF